MTAMLIEWASTTIGFSVLAFTVIVVFCSISLIAIKLIEFFAYRSDLSSLP